MGILWGRIGTPTPRAKSGTLEEFEGAYSRWQRAPEELEIMLYFKDAPIRPSEFDGAQSDKVQDFKRSLGEDGVFHWTFDGPENFESLRTHLSAVAQRWAKRGMVPSAAERPAKLENAIESVPSEPDDDLGFLDYIDRYNLSMEQMNAGIHAVGDATAAVGEQMNRRASEMREIGDIDDPGRYKEARRAIKASADDMNRFADILDGQLPLLASSRKEAFESLSKALALSEDFDRDDKSDIEALETSLRGMVEAAAGALGSMGGFRQSVRDLPRLTSDVNKAKRRTVKALDLFISEVETTISTARNLLGSLP